MKILNIEIANFGKLSDFTISFNDNLSKIIENNGWGKSTLSDFICVMFYGFKDESKKNKDEREREKYRPWQGGDYGGSITFETNGIKYFITRLFGTKESEDKFALKNLDKNVASKDFSCNIGIELFDLDRDSFERTIYIDRNGCHTSMTSSISAKLGNLIDNTDDINNFDTADAALKDILNSMSPTTKRGSIKKLEDEIYNLSVNTERKDEVLSNLEKEKKEKEDKEAELSKLNNKLKELQDEQNQLSKFKDIQAKKAKYEDLLKNVKERKNILDENKLKFPKEVPNSKDLGVAIEKASILNGKLSERNAYLLTDEQKTRYSYLEGIFYNKPTSLDEINIIKNSIKEINKVEFNAAKYQLSDEEQNYINNYSKIFSDYPVDKNQINTLKEKWNERNLKKNLLEYKKNNKTTSNNSLLIVSIILLILSITGIICSFLFKEKISNIFIYMIAILTAVVLLDIVLFIKAIKSNKSTGLQNDDVEDMVYIESVDNEISSLLKTYNIIFDENGIITKLDSIIFSFDKYNEFKDKNKKYIDSTNDPKIVSDKNKILDYLAKYATVNSFKECENEIDKLFNIYKEFNALQDRANSFKLLDKTCDHIENELNNYLNLLGYSNVSSYETKLKNISDDLNTYIVSIDEYNNSLNQLDEFKKNNDINILINISTDNNKSVEQLNNEITETTVKIDNLKEEIHNINDYLDDIRGSYDSIVDDEKGLNEKKIRISYEKEKYELLKITRKLLSEAKSSFINRYVGPISKSFKKYYEMASHESPDKFMFDANANLTYEEHGLDRNENTLSSGYQDVVGLCTRMALVDAMYQKEKPFIIMDDPFTNLDKDKVNGSLSLIEKMSEDYQIIYLTCHESRK